MRGFIEELRHRNVFRVGVAYVVVGWLVVQVADLIADVFDAPAWLMQTLVIVLLLGLPVALFLAWAFELTPEGMMKAEDVPVDAPKDPRSGRVLNIVTISTLAVAVLWLGWDKLQRPAELAATADKSIAVLPFDDFSPEGDQAWFADGLTEEILNSLARTADLHVASRTSSFAFRGTTKDIPAIAAELGVAHVLEGSVRRASDRLRVTAQLIRASDDKHLWSETFDGSNEDSIVIQEEIAIAIASALQTAMDPETLARMVAAGTRSVAAWETYLRGLSLNHQVRSQMDVGKIFDVIAVFDQAVALDPSFADAHLMLANLWESQINPAAASYNSDGPPYAERRSRYDAAITGAIKYARSDVTRTESEMRIAAFDLRVTDQIALAQRMAELEPHRRQGWGWLQYLYLATGDYEKSREAGLTAWAIEPGLGETDGAVINYMHPVSIDDTVMIIDKALQVPNPSLNVIYQSHRGLLAAGQVARAAGLVDDFAGRSSDEVGEVIMRLRQACAEGRVDDADELFATVDADSNTRWLLLKTLGRDDEARELLRELDTPETLYALSGFLTYPSFEARDYPLLWKTLTAQGINRPPATPMPYRCEHK